MLECLYVVPYKGEGCKCICIRVAVSTYVGSGVEAEVEVAMRKSIYRHVGPTIYLVFFFFLYVLG